MHRLSSMWYGARRPAHRPAAVMRHSGKTCRSAMGGLGDHLAGLMTGAHWMRPRQDLRQRPRRGDRAEARLDDRGAARASSCASSSAVSSACRARARAAHHREANAQSSPARLNWHRRLASPIGATIMPAAGYRLLAAFLDGRVVTRRPRRRLAACETPRCAPARLRALRVIAPQDGAAACVRARLRRLAVWTTRRGLVTLLAVPILPETA